jgi:hypothetical protein
VSRKEYHSTDQSPQKKVLVMGPVMDVDSAEMTVQPMDSMLGMSQVDRPVVGLGDMTAVETDSSLAPSKSGITVVPKVAYLVDRKEPQQVVGMAADSAVSMVELMAMHWAGVGCRLG